MGRADIFVPPAVGIRKYACEFLDWTPWYRRLLLLNMSWISSRKQKYLFSSLPGWYFDCQLPKDGIWFPLKRKTASPKEPERILNQTQICICICMFIWPDQFWPASETFFTQNVWDPKKGCLRWGPERSDWKRCLTQGPERPQNVTSEKGV